MKVATLADVKARLGEFVDACEATGPVLITRRGKPVAVLVAPTDEGELERMQLAGSPKFQALLAKSMKSVQDGQGLSHEEFWKIVERRAAKRARAKSKPRAKSRQRVATSR